MKQKKKRKGRGKGKGKCKDCKLDAMSAAACWSRTAGGWAGSGEKGKAVAGPWGSGGLLGHSGAALGRCLFFDFLAEDLFGQRTAKQKKPHQNSFFLPLSLSFCMGQPDLISLLSAYRR